MATDHRPSIRTSSLKNAGQDASLRDITRPEERAFRSVLEGIPCEGVMALTLQEEWAQRQLRLCTRRAEAPLPVHVQRLLECLSRHHPADHGALHGHKANEGIA